MITLLNLEVENFLSLEKLDLDLSSLNILVGPNGAGKTNILKVFQFLGEIARLDLIPAIDRMGNFHDILFRGTERKGQSIKLRFKGVISEHASLNAPDEYTLTFWERNLNISPDGRPRRIVQRQEAIVLKRMPGRGRRITLTGRSLKVASIGDQNKRMVPGPLSVQGAATGLATLRRLGEEYEASGVEALAQVFEQLRLFEIDVDRIRRPSRNSRSSQLRHDASNLSEYLLYLSDDHPSIFSQIEDDVRFVLPSFRSFSFMRFEGGEDAVRLDIIEDKLEGVTSLSRASFGTIRAIALFAMLNDPSPPRLTCLEEIDHGLHPHALDRLVDRLRDASSRTQIILATYSPALVNRFDASELVVVERDEDRGSTRALKPDKSLITRLQNETGYGLGELWFSGALGGGL